MLIILIVFFILHWHTVNMEAGKLPFADGSMLEVVDMLGGHTAKSLNSSQCWLQDTENVSSAGSIDSGVTPYGALI